jgi:hypothetical protein
MVLNHYKIFTVVWLNFMKYSVMPDIFRPYGTSVLLGLLFIFYQSNVPLGLSR